MKKVLFVMDIQEDTTGVTAKKGPFPIKNHQNLIDQINDCITAYEKAGDTVVYVKNIMPNKFIFKLIGICVQGTFGSQMDSRIKVVSNHHYEKNKPSAFRNKQLVDFIKNNEFTHLEITGIDKAQCCAATASDAIAMGLNTCMNNSATATTVPWKLNRVMKKLKKMGVEFVN